MRRFQMSWKWCAQNPSSVSLGSVPGASAAAGMFGPAPAGKPVALIGISHFRFRGKEIVEEWTMFDGMAALIQAHS